MEEPTLLVICIKGICIGDELGPGSRSDMKANLVEGKVYEAIDCEDNAHYRIPAVHPTFGFLRSRFVPAPKELCERYNRVVVRDYYFPAWEVK